jgi:large subunit ribosomal protein L14
MIQKNTSLMVTDNCGARKAKCIHVLGNLHFGKVGDLILVVLRNLYNSQKKVKKGSIYLGIITGTKY